MNKASEVKSEAERWLVFCARLHTRLSAALADPIEIRQRVEALRTRNSFRESCYCKGCVLPIVDEVTTEYLTSVARAPREEVHRSLRCEGYETPLYDCRTSHVGFSGYSRSNSYHPGAKSGRRQQSRRSPDFCIRYQPDLRMVGEVKYVRGGAATKTKQTLDELREYLSIVGEPSSDWGHDFGFGLIYAYSGDAARRIEAITDYWESERIFMTRFST